MARNIARDKREAAYRREQLMDVGFRLFAEHGIDAVSLQSIAADADVGIATLYKYYPTKAHLVVAISGRVWGRVWQKADAESEGFAGFSAYDCIAYYADRIIRLYQKFPALLRFSSDDKNYIRREGIDGTQLSAHLDMLAPLETLFHTAYMRAVADGSIRTDISERELFTTASITMLSVAERYAQGIVWADNGKSDHTPELLHLKEMLLLWCTAGCGGGDDGCR